MWAKTGGTMQYENTLVNGGNGGEYGNMNIFLKRPCYHYGRHFLERTHCAPWTVFQSIPSNASEPNNSRKMIL
jgi:hypothetical protein